MGLVHELQNSIEKDDVLTVLRKARTVATRLRVSDIDHWLRCEKEGYGDDDDIPNYRTVLCQLVYITNGPIPAGMGQVQDGGFPVPGISPLEQRLAHSLKELVAMVAQVDSGHQVGIPFDDEEMIRRLRQKFNPRFRHQLTFSLKVEGGQLCTIIEAVKDRIHDWTCELLRRGVHGAGETFDEREPEAAHNIILNPKNSTFNQAGGATNGGHIHMSNTTNGVNTGGGSIDNRGGNFIQAHNIIFSPRIGVTPHAGQATSELQPEEAVILTRLLDARDQTLVYWHADDGYCILIGGQSINDPKDVEVSQSYIEGLQRLDKYGLLANNSGDRQMYTLSSAGRALAKQLRGKCPWCSKPMGNAGKDPKQPPVWECNNTDCLHSIWHRNKRCEVCCKRPVEITDSGCGYASYRCEDGHSWTKMAGKD